MEVLGSGGNSETDILRVVGCDKLLELRSGHPHVARGRFGCRRSNDGVPSSRRGYVSFYGGKRNFNALLIVQSGGVNEGDLRGSVISADDLVLRVVHEGRGEEQVKLPGEVEDSEVSF